MNKSMTTDEQKLQQYMRNTPQGHNPFRVPEDYFSTLQSRITDRIRQTRSHPSHTESTGTQPEVSGHTSRFLHDWQGRGIWKRLAVAAVFTGLFSIVGTTLYRQHRDATSLPSEDVNTISAITGMEYDDDLLDYAMLSNSDIEYYLTSAE